MKKLLLLAVAALALACAGVAAADNGNDTKSENGAQTGHISRTYLNPIGGTWTCSGERIAKTEPKVFTKDSEDCTISDPATFLAPGTYVATPYFTLNGTLWGWSSDFDGRTATTVTYVVTDNGDGTANVSIVAYY